MKYIVKNIRSFAKDYTKIFALLIITIAASTIIIHFSYGMFRQYEDKRELSRSGTKQIVFQLNGSYVQKNSLDGSSQEMINPCDLKFQTYEKQNNRKDVTVGEMKQFAKELNEGIASKLLNIHTEILQGNYGFSTDFLLLGRKVVNSGDYGADALYNYVTFNGMTQNIFEYGRYFTDEEYTQGKRVCIMYGFQKTLRGDYLKKNLLKDGQVLIGNKKYTIIGLQSGTGTGYIPITSVNEDGILLNKIDLQFQDNISIREVNLLYKTAKKCFGNQVTCNYELEKTQENNYLYNTILLLILVVSLVAAFNFCALYHYIVTTRQRTLTIFRICGLSYGKSVGLYLGECSLLSGVTYVVALLLFHFVLMPFLAGQMDIFDFHFKAEVYFVLFLIYFISSFLLQSIMIIWNLKKRMIR